MAEVSRSSYLTDISIGASRSDRRQPGKPHGRYDGRSSNTRSAPGGQLGQKPKGSRNHAVVTAAIVDPMGDGDERIYAAINRRVDILEMERSHNRISEAAYRTGREVQRVLERSTRVSGTNWAGTSRVDAGEAKELQTIRTVCNAKDALAMEARIRDRLGEIGARLLRRIVGDGFTYAQCAALVGKAGPRGEAYIATRFRETLEDLAEAWTAKGKVVPPPDDKYLAASVDMYERQGPVRP